ncbi:MAG: hypothetical protein EXS31_07315 [Pedosphaera sp.]|nr:hypothetical protein [Pedosphaera sp.]
MRGTKGKLLVIRGGAIGDFILTLPVLTALRQQFPDSHLEVLGYPHIVQLAEAGGLVNCVRPIEARALAGFFGRGGSLDAEFAQYFAGFGLVLSYLYDPDGIFQENVARCSKAQFIAGPHMPDDKGRIHATETLLKPLEHLAVFGAEREPQLKLKPRTSRPRESGSGTWIALHPGSGSERKNWPEARWLELLVQLVRETNWNFLLCGGEVEGDRLDRLTREIPPKRCRVEMARPLVELAFMLTECDFFLGHDSGISHLAAALGLPGLVLWGPTDPKVWRPLSKRFQILHPADGLSALSAEEVVQRLKEAVMSHQPKNGS